MVRNPDCADMMAYQAALECVERWALQSGNDMILITFSLLVGFLNEAKRDLRKLQLSYHDLGG